ncbi:MAG: hypothetical protein J5851_08170 [Oscillospiraceae bacterium]|nr:hypothetical protein [Oscillospiraceae bacterium]
MEKPHATKQLALYALVCAGGCFVIQSCCALLAGQFSGLFGSVSVDLEPQWKLLLIAISAFSALPMAGVALWSMLSKDITKSKAMTTVILTPILFVAGGLAGSGMRVLTTRALVSTGVDSYGAFATAQSSMSLFGLLNTAALVLICCAGAIELYLTTHTPSDGGTH